MESGVLPKPRLDLGVRVRGVVVDAEVERLRVIAAKLISKLPRCVRRT